MLKYINPDHKAIDSKKEDDEGKMLTELTREYLRKKEALIIMDNADRVINDDYTNFRALLS